MHYSKLGSSDLLVSRVCLGSMTWGMQNDQWQADEQIDAALAQGINFIDTAEMYAVPPTPETYGATETIIGNWLAKNQQKRSKIVIATKIAGPGLPWVRNGGPITGKAVEAAVDASLARLQTDYIDLYQLHWPNRTSSHFGKHWPNQVQFSDADTQENIASMLDILQGLDRCVRAGKIRHCGLSDDSPWGLNTFLRLSEQYDLPAMVSIQNEFNLLHSKDWPHLIENCIHEKVAYLPWSPLAAGVLSGKYIDGARPHGSRWSISNQASLFRDTPMTNDAVKQYMHVAQKHNVTVAQLALAWCNQIDGVTSTIIGATNLKQLEENIDAFDLVLNEEMIQDVTSVLKQFPSTF
ncbi:hypothetical protein TYM08_P3838 [Marinicellulosiphila megalodicopiae]